MPKVYLTQEERQLKRIIRTLQAESKGKQKELAKVWGITQQGVSHRINTGAVTIIDLWKAREIINPEEISQLF